MRPLEPVPTNLFTSRNDSEDPRLGERIVLNFEPAEKGWIEMIGWPDDEGIRLNGGRVGAALAPNQIRRILFRMTPDARTDSQPRWADLGNLPLSLPLADRHTLARGWVKRSLLRGSQLITLGGGHDFGFPDGAGFLDAVQGGPRPMVLNFDAHLDVRPTDKGFHSGTPFRRLLTEFSGRFDFVEIGLQPQCNSRSHRDWALTQKAELWWAADLMDPAVFTRRLKDYLDARPGAPIFLSFDIDVVTSASAPGCSQSWDTGLPSEHLFTAIDLARAHGGLRMMGIYEVSPPLDVDDRTSKLAALLAFHFARSKS